MTSDQDNIFSIGDYIEDSDKGEDSNSQKESSASNAIWLSISEAAKLGGVQNKTMRRAIQTNLIKYKIVKNRYLVDFFSVIIYLHTKTKLKNKFRQFGIGQYIEKWKI